MSIIFIHELGHLLTARYFNWKIDKIYIYPLGGITKINDKINKPLKEEIIIVLMGPIFQMIYYYVLIKMGVQDILLFNLILLLFNLLPIYPLDGGKILNLVFSFFLSYKLSYKITFFFSFLFYIILVLFSLFYFHSLIFIIVIFFLIFKIIDEYSKQNYYFSKFLLERYLNNYRFKKIKFIKGINSMQRDKTHFFKKNNQVITEKEFLREHFNIVYNK